MHNTYVSVTNFNHNTLKQVYHLNLCITVLLRNSKFENAAKV